MNFLKLFFVASFVLTVSTSQAQFFEGKITYSVSYEIKKDDPNLHDLEQKMGNIMEYYIKNGNYKSILLFNDEIISTNTYSPSENRIYTEYPNSPYMYWQNCSYTEDTLVSIDFSDEIISLNNYDCRGLTITTNDSRTSYFSTEQLKIDPTTFNGHNMAFWHKRLELTNGALSVQLVTEYDDYIVTKTLTVVEEKPLDDKIWEIDEKKIAIASGRELTSRPEMIGGLESFYRCFSSNVKYPKNARKKNIEGKVFVRFLVNEDGSMSHIEIVKGLDPEIDAQALLGFSRCEGKWTPAYMGKNPVKCLMILPVTFKLH